MRVEVRKQPESAKEVPLETIGIGDAFWLNGRLYARTGRVVDSGRLLVHDLDNGGWYRFRLKTLVIPAPDAVVTVDVDRRGDGG